MVDFFLKPQKARLLDEINCLPEGALLEIGVGNGAHLHLYKKHRITGIDTSSEMLRTARKRDHRQIQLLQMIGEAMLFEEGQFDYVVLSHVIAVVDNPQQLLEEVFRVSKPKGKVIILNHFTPNNWLRYVDHAFRIISKTFHFKAVFHIHKITALNRFRLLKEVSFGPIGYFKLLIYQKK